MWAQIEAWNVKSVMLLHYRSNFKRFLTNPPQNISIWSGMSTDNFTIFPSSLFIIHHSVMKWHTNHGSGCISYWSPTEVTDWSEQKRQHKEERDDIIEGDCPRHNKQIKKKRRQINTNLRNRIRAASETCIVVNCRIL